MPLFEYKCTNCNEQVDKLKSIDEPPITVCPHCMLPTLLKQFSAPQFLLSGSGFHKAGRF